MQHLHLQHFCTKVCWPCESHWTQENASRLPNANVDSSGKTAATSFTFGTSSPLQKLRVIIECFGLKYCHRLSSRWSPLRVAKTFKVRLILKPATQTGTSRTNDFHKANFAVEMEARRKHFLFSTNANVNRCPKGEAGCRHLTQGITEIFFKASLGGPHLCF